MDLSNFKSLQQTRSYNPGPKQLAATELLASPARHILGRGGSRSGKTFLFCRAIIIRAAKAAGSTHSIFREHFNHLKHSVIYDTMPTVAKLCFPQLKMRLDKTDWFHELPNGSKIIYGGLDDKQRTEKILGQEHSTIYLVEISQISYSARNLAMTRLAQNSGLVLKAYYDCNPPPKSHWSYKLFIRKEEPSSGKPLDRPENYATFKLNPRDNLMNLPASVIEELQALPAKDQKRFLEGEYADAVENALWQLEQFQRIQEPTNHDEREKLLRRFNRVVISVDPSGCEGEEDERSDEIGLVACGLDGNRDTGIGYILEDCTGHYAPEMWAKKACEMYDRWQADTIIGETNYGGDMVRAVIQGERANIPVKKITVSRGKHIRAAPISALYAKNRVKHAGIFVDMEDELCNFATDGYKGERSPNRADAGIFGLTELMLDPIKSKAGVLF